jgi:hypothetical protein
MWQSYRMGERYGQAGVQRQWSAEQLLQANQQINAEQSARTNELQLQQRIDQLQKENRYAQDKITRRYAVDAQRLLERPERADAATSARATPAGTCAGQSGAGLARGDAAFLAGYAADAARLAAALELCVVAYEQARCGQASNCYRTNFP